ncbi:MAG: hypothetical protein O3A01_00460 [bacterium]|nr:hypothetical protein [bacterium]
MENIRQTSTAPPCYVSWQDGRNRLTARAASPVNVPPQYAVSAVHDIPINDESRLLTNIFPHQTSSPQFLLAYNLLSRFLMPVERNTVMTILNQDAVKTYLSHTPNALGGLVEILEEAQINLPLAKIALENIPDLIQENPNLLGEDTLALAKKNMKDALFWVKTCQEKCPLLYEIQEGQYAAILLEMSSKLTPGQCAILLEFLPKCHVKRDITTVLMTIKQPELLLEDSKKKLSRYFTSCAIQARLAQ